MEKWTDEQIRELCDKATAGPWKTQVGYIGAEHHLFLSIPGHDGVSFGRRGAPEQRDANVRLSAAARELVPQLLDRAEAAEAQVVDLIAARDYLSEQLQKVEAELLEEEVTNEALLADADTLRNELFAYIRDIKNQNKLIHELEQERNDLKAMLADAGVRNAVLEKRVERLIDVLYLDHEQLPEGYCETPPDGVDCELAYECRKCWREWLEQEVQA